MFDEHLPDSLQHAAHTADKHDLLLENVAFTFLFNRRRMSLVAEDLGDGCTCRRVRLILLLLLQFLRTALLKQFVHHGADFFNQEGHGPFEEVHAAR